MSTTTSIIYHLNNNDNDHHNQRCQRRNSLPRMNGSSLNKNYKKYGICSSSGLEFGSCFNNHNHHGTYDYNYQMATSKTSTSTVSLHYISQYLTTPDTLILPQKFLQAAAAAQSSTCNHKMCHHHHHIHQKHQRIHLDMKLIHNENLNKIETPDDSMVDAATAQLEEIIRLCRTLQKNPNLTTSNGVVNGELLCSPTSKYYCSGCNISYSRCRCSADCIQCFLQQDADSDVESSESLMTDDVKTPAIHQYFIKNNDRNSTKTTAGDETNIKHGNSVSMVINHNPEKSELSLINDDGDSGDDLRVINNKDTSKFQVLIVDCNNMEKQHEQQDKEKDLIEEKKYRNAAKINASTNNKSSTPPAHYYHHQHQNIDASTNNNNNTTIGTNRFVTQLVAKFEEKSSQSRSSSLSPFNYQNSKQVRDNDNTYTAINHQQISLLSTLNDKEHIQLSLPTTATSTDPSSASTITTFKDHHSNPNNVINNNDNDAKPKLRIKPKPPPKPASLILLSSLSPPSLSSSSSSSSSSSFVTHLATSLPSSVLVSDKSSVNSKLSPKDQEETLFAIEASVQRNETRVLVKPLVSNNNDSNDNQQIDTTGIIIESLPFSLSPTSNDNHNNEECNENILVDSESTSDNEIMLMKSIPMHHNHHHHPSPQLTLQVTDLDQIIEQTMTKDNKKELFSDVNMDDKSSTITNTNNKCQSYCCCCCCPSTGNCCNGMNNKLLGIDLTKIQQAAPVPKPRKNNNKSNMGKTSSSMVATSLPMNNNHVCQSLMVVDSASSSGDLNVKDNPHLNQQQPTLTESTSTKLITKRKTIKCSDVVNDSDVLVVVEEVNETNSDETSPVGSNDNSSSDEGIENPAVLDDEELDDDDEVDLLNKSKLSVESSNNCHYHHLHRNYSSHSHHSHHQHHFNHHNQLVNHYQDPCKSPSLSFKSSRTVSPLFPSSTNPDDVHQVERFLNGTNSKHLNTLKQEESLLLKEIFELESEQSETAIDLKDNEEIDEELLEFQRIEREIKLSELRKCLQIVQKQIHTYKIKLDQQEHTPKIEFDTIIMATTSDSSLLNKPCQPDQAEQQVENDITALVESKSTTMAPLAEPENDEADLRIDSIEPDVALANHELDLSDSDSDPDEVIEPPKTENVNKEELVRSLDDLLHESIETRLEKVNNLTEQEQESFVVKMKLQEAGTSLVRRTSQYDNEHVHDCHMKHFGYQRNVDMLMLKSVYQKLDLDKQGLDVNAKHNIMNVSSISNEMLESTTTATDSETDSIVLRRRSARFPAGENDSNPNLQSQDELSAHSDQPILRKRNSAISNSSTVGGSQRPLTLYMPAPNQKINLITHLHALGHDLTSSIVTNHLLLTPYTCSGYLYKHCSSGVGKWRKRYFHFDRVRKVFVYYHDRADFEKMRHPKRGLFFDEIQDVYVDHTRINMKKFLSNSSNDKQSHLSNQHKYGSPGAMVNPTKADGTRCVFVVSTATFSRKFILSTYTPELMRIWMDVIFTGAQAYLQDFDDQMN